MKIVDPIVTFCAAIIALFFVLNGVASWSIFQSFELLQLFPSFDFVVWLLAAILLIFSISIGGRRVALVVVFFMLSLQLVVRHSDRSVGFKSNATRGETLKIMSLNAGQFSNDTSVVRQCVELIRSENPDIVCLQEFGLYYKWPDVRSVSIDFAEKINCTYFDFSPKPGNIFGTAFFSKYEIEAIDTVFQLLSHTNEAKVYTVNVNGKRITIANVHLQSYNLFSVKNSASLTSISEAINARNAQVMDLLEFEADAMVGDFNASPGTIVHDKLCAKYVDVHRTYGNPFSFTHQSFPTRLDYVFVRENTAIDRFSVNADSPSDHKALVIKISF